MTNNNTSSKKCFKCGNVKPRSEFYKHGQMADGLLGKCKSCAKFDSTSHRMKNLDDVRAYDRMRGKTQHRLDAAKEQTKRWRSEDLRRSKAHNAVARALRHGNLDKMPCVVCGSNKSLAHHESYDRPLSVIWYCQIHHKQRHAQMAIEEIRQ